MKGKMAKASILPLLWVCLLYAAGGATPAAAQVQVNSADPPAAPQGTVNLNVLIKGKGFKKGAVAQFLVAGSTNPGGITVNATSFVSSTDLIANINVAENAVLSKFDIVVRNSDGRTGKGTELFAVTAKDPEIVYEGWTAQGINLMVVQADGTGNGRLLGQSGINMRSPSWSPDGSQIAFSSNLDGGGIFVVNKDGSGLRKVIAIADGFVDPDWSPVALPDGSFKLAYRGFDGDIHAVNLDGTGDVNLTQTPDWDEFFPTWSPDATRLAAQTYINGQAELVVYDIGLVGGELVAVGNTVLTDSGPLADHSIFVNDWSHDGLRIVVATRAPGANHGDLWVIDLADPANPMNVTNTASVHEAQPVWSPDDTQILFRRDAGSTRKANTLGLYRLRLADGALFKVAGVDKQTQDTQDPDWRRVP